MDNHIKTIHLGDTDIQPVINSALSLCAQFYLLACNPSVCPVERVFAISQLADDLVLSFNNFVTDQEGLADGLLQSSVTPS